MAMATPNPLAFPFRLHWTPDQLARSVPLRLFELPLFDMAAAPAAANALPPRVRRPAHPRYAPAAALATRFHVA